MKDNIDNIGDYLGQCMDMFSGIMFHTKIRPLRELQKYSKITRNIYIMTISSIRRRTDE